MTLNQLDCFCELARTEHVTKAAEKLSIPQSSLSRHISALEKELNTELFEKQGRSIALTKNGHMFFEYISKGLSMIDQGIQCIHESADPDGGIIDFAFIYALTPRYIPDRIKEFRSSVSEKNAFRFHQANTKNILPFIQDGTYDFGICSWMDGHPELDFHPLIRQEYVLVVSDSHPMAGRSSVSLREAAEYSFILPLDKTSFVESLFHDRNLSPRITSRVEEDQAAAALVSTGLGLAILPMNPVLNYYQIRQIPFAPDPVYRTFYLVRDAERSLSPAAERFYWFLRKHPTSVISALQEEPLPLFR